MISMFYCGRYENGIISYNLMNPVQIVMIYNCSIIILTSSAMGVSTENAFQSVYFDLAPVGTTRQHVLQNGTYYRNLKTDFLWLT